MPIDSANRYDLFISYSRADAEWVGTLHARLQSLGIRCFLDVGDLTPGASFVGELGDALQGSRFLALIVTPRSAESRWVAQEWQSFLATHGPRGRILPVVLAPAAVHAMLSAVHQIDAIDQNVERVAVELGSLVRRAADAPVGDARRLYLGQDLVFAVERLADELRATDPAGHVRTVPLPSSADPSFASALQTFDRLTRRPVNDDDRADLTRAATMLGARLFDTLFDADGIERLQRAVRPGASRPLVTIRSDDDMLLALPWELLHHDGKFLLRDGRVDVVRSSISDVATDTLLREPTDAFRLVVNVSAPEGSLLAYEEESYRITKALAGSCEMVPTELGTLDDLAETIARVRPTGVHFSGHGAPGALQFEDDEGHGDIVTVGAMLSALRAKQPDGAPIHFLYLASCHGNDLRATHESDDAVESTAGALHREGVTQVVGYHGPIDDVLSTRAEFALYDAVARGETTRYAVRQAREALSRQPSTEWRYRIEDRDATGALRAPGATAPNDTAHTHPFAWSQIVLYQRGPEHPLGLPRDVDDVTRDDESLHRTVDRVGGLPALRAGFIGRRVELHQLRRRVRRGDRIFVLQGLGGLGKTTLAMQLLPTLASTADVCVLRCQDAEQHDDPAEMLVQQLLTFCRKRFEVAWESVVHQVDRIAGDAAEERFGYFLQALVQNVDGLALYFDNLESLLVAPRRGSPETAPMAEGEFAAWRSPSLAAIWHISCQVAERSGKLRVVASTRYRNDDLDANLLPVSALPRDALFRLTAWFPALRRLTSANRLRLAARLSGHPRSVELANDLVHDALRRWERNHGEWRLTIGPTADDIDREWATVVEPVLPNVRDKLWDDLLLSALWERVLGEAERRMLWRMTLLRRPWTWDLVPAIGDPDASPTAIEATAEHLRQTSLLEQVYLFRRTEGRQSHPTPVLHHTLHAATAEFAAGRSIIDVNSRRLAHLRMGDALVARAAQSPYIADDIEAGHHLLEGEEYDRAFDTLGPTSEWLQERGQVREGIRILQPLLERNRIASMTPDRAGVALGLIGVAYARLGQVERAIGFYMQQLAIVRTTGNRRGEEIALGNLGTAYMRLGHVERAIRHFEQALVIDREVADRYGEGADLCNLGNAYANLGQVERAVDFYQQGLAVMREVGHRTGEATALGNLGLAHAEIGEVKRAIGFYEQQLVIVRETGDRHGEGNAIGNLGIAYRMLNEIERAIGLYEQQLVLVRETGDRYGEGNVNGNLGNAYADLGQVERAIGFYEQQLVIVRETGERRGEGNALGNLGAAYANLGQVERAIGFYEQQLLIAREIGDRRGEGTALGNVGIAYGQQGDHTMAIGALREALRIGQEIKDPRIIQFATAALKRVGTGA